MAQHVGDAVGRVHMRIATIPEDLEQGLFSGQYGDDPKFQL